MLYRHPSSYTVNARVQQVLFSERFISFKMPNYLDRFCFMSGLFCPDVWLTFVSVKPQQERSDPEDLTVCLLQDSCSKISSAGQGKQHHMGFYWVKDMLTVACWELKSSSGLDSVRTSCHVKQNHLLCAFIGLDEPSCHPSTAGASVAIVLVDILSKLLAPQTCLDTNKTL